MTPAYLLSGSETGFAVTPYGEWESKELEIMVRHLEIAPGEVLRIATKRQSQRCYAAASNLIRLPWARSLISSYSPPIRQRTLPCCKTRKPSSRPGSAGNASICRVPKAACRATPANWPKVCTDEALHTPVNARSDACFAHDKAKGRIMTDDGVDTVPVTRRYRFPEADCSRIPFGMYHDAEIYALEQERVFRGAGVELPRTRMRDPQSRRLPHCDSRRHAGNRQPDQRWKGRRLRQPLRP